MKLTINVCSSVAEIMKLPLPSLMAIGAVGKPFTLMDAPGIGPPLSSVIFPVMVFAGAYITHYLTLQHKEPYPHF